MYPSQKFGAIFGTVDNACLFGNRFINHFGGSDDEPSQIEKETVLVHPNVTAR
jgi:hypothetical protein